MNTKMKTKMKLIAVMALFCAVLFTGCKKDDENYPLNGTTWFSTETTTVGSTIYVEENTIDFSTTTMQVTVVEKTIKNVQTSTTTNGGSGTYTYEHPKVTMTANGETISGTINGNKLTAGDFVFIKQ